MLKKLSIIFGTAVLAVFLAYPAIGPAHASPRHKTPAPKTAIAQDQRDIPADIQAAMNDLNDAMQKLQSAGARYGGFRATALTHVQEARTELQYAMQYVQQHPGATR